MTAPASPSGGHNPAAGTGAFGTAAADARPGPLKRLFHRLDDAVNPIVVKELRQAMHGRFVPIVFLLFLALALVTFIFAVIDADLGHPGAGFNAAVSLRVVLDIICLLALPLFIGMRLALERSDANTDLLFATTIPARRVIGGKALAGLILVALTYAACAPLILLTYLIGGVDMPSLLVSLALGLVTAGCAIMLMIFLASLTVNRIARVVLAIAAFIILLTLLHHSTGIFHAFEAGFNYLLLRRGLIAAFADSETVITATLALTYSLGIAVLMFLMAAAMIKPQSSNRALPVRIGITAFWIVQMLVAIILLWEVVEPMDAIDVGAVNAAGILSFILYFNILLLALAQWWAICERDEPGRRTGQTIPRNIPMRIAAFILYAGAAGGLVWTWLMIGLTFGGIWLIATQVAPANTWDGIVEERTVTAAAALAILLYAYAITALALHRGLLPKALRYEHTWGIALTLLALLCALPPVLATIIDPDQLRHAVEPPAWAAINPFVLPHESETFINRAIVINAVWAGAVTLIMLPWFYYRLRAFKPEQRG